MHNRSNVELDALALLGEPVRRRLYDYVVGQAEPVDRDRAAAAVEIGRSLAAFHLDRLVGGGLLDVQYHRRSGRTGPGAGRPAKFYLRAAERQVEVSLPPRRYGLAAEILADGIERTAESDAVEGVLDAARAIGKRLAATAEPGAAGAESLMTVLSANGYEPAPEEDGVIRLRNCPFHALAQGHRPLTCSMNLALLRSVATAIPATGVIAEPHPADGFCCVAFIPATSSPRI